MPFPRSSAGRQLLRACPAAALCRKYIVIFLLTTIAIFSPGPSCALEIKASEQVLDNQPIDVSSPAYQQFFAELRHQHGFAQEELTRLFSGLTIDKKVLELMDKQWESKPYYQYRALFIDTNVITTGKTHLQQNTRLFDRLEARYGVDREAIVAIWAVESRYGKQQGKYQLFRTLNTLFAAYPRRADYFRKELLDFLILCRQNKLDPLSINGSYAGAFGQAQFMPSSFLAYAQDFDGDSKRDLINFSPDVFASIANYLSRFGWRLHAPLFHDAGTTLRDPALRTVVSQGRKGRVHWRQLSGIQQIDLPQPTGNGLLALLELEKSPEEGGGFRYVAAYPNLLAITEYNHSTRYAMAVSELIESFRN